jgi:nucleoside-diphosphate-sugar epimerase
MHKQKVVVTGGAGFIGSHIVDALVEQDFEMHVIDNYAAGKREDRLNKKATYHDVDIRAYDDIVPIIKDATYVFHEAALPRVQFSIEYPLETMAVNVTGTANVLRAAHQGGVKRVISASSGSVYGDQSIMPLVETMLPCPKSPYGLHKYTLERLSKLWSEVYGLETVALRYFNVYGPRMDPNGAYALAIAKFILQRQQGKPITIWGDGSHSRDFTHVRDVVRANILAATSELVGKGEVINIGAGRNITVKEMARLIGGSCVHEPERLEPKDALANNTKARELLGWQPQVVFEDGINELKKLANLQ